MRTGLFCKSEKMRRFKRSFEAFQLSTPTAWKNSFTSMASIWKFGLTSTRELRVFFSSAEAVDSLIF